MPASALQVDFFTVTQPLHSGPVFELEREEGVTLWSWVFSTKLNLLNLPVAILQATFCLYFLFKAAEICCKTECCYLPGKKTNFNFLSW